MSFETESELVSHIITSIADRRTSRRPFRRLDALRPKSALHVTNPSADRRSSNLILASADCQPASEYSTPICEFPRFRVPGQLKLREPQVHLAPAGRLAGLSSLGRPGVGSQGNRTSGRGPDTKAPRRRTSFDTRNTFVTDELRLRRLPAEKAVPPVSVSSVAGWISRRSAR